MEKKEMPEWLKENADGSVDITLAGKKRLTIDGVEVTALRMREPTVDDQLAQEKIQGSAAEKEIGLMANLCQVTPAQISGLSLRNYKRVQAAFVGFTD